MFPPPPVIVSKDITFVSSPSIYENHLPNLSVTLISDQFGRVSLRKLYNDTEYPISIAAASVIANFVLPNSAVHPARLIGMQAAYLDSAIQRNCFDAVDALLV